MTIDFKVVSWYGLGIWWLRCCMFHSGDTYSQQEGSNIRIHNIIDDVRRWITGAKIVICACRHPWIKDLHGSGFIRIKMYIAISLVGIGQFFLISFERYMKKELEKWLPTRGPRITLLYAYRLAYLPICILISIYETLICRREKKELILWKHAADLFKIDVSKF